MAVLDDMLAREYFETLGYLVVQPTKYVVPGKPKRAEEGIDLIVFNPSITEHRLPEEFVLTSVELSTVARAVVSVRGWHTERFYASTIEQTPDILRFVDEQSIRFAKRFLGADTMAKILCLPNLPASGELKKKTIDVLRSRGIDGIISFRTMLLELIDTVDTNRNYEKSDLLQTIRVLKNYELLKDSQMDLFDRKHRARPAKSRAAKAETPDADAAKASS